MASIFNTDIFELQREWSQRVAFNEAYEKQKIAEATAAGRDAFSLGLDRSEARDNYFAHIADRRLEAQQFFSDNARPALDSVVDLGFDSRTAPLGEHHLSEPFEDGGVSIGGVDIDDMSDEVFRAAAGYDPIPDPSFKISPDGSFVATDRDGELNYHNPNAHFDPAAHEWLVWDDDKGDFVDPSLSVASQFDSDFDPDIDVSDPEWVCAFDPDWDVNLEVASDNSDDMSNLEFRAAAGYDLY